MGCCASKPQEQAQPRITKPAAQPALGFQLGPIQEAASPQGTLQAIISSAGWLSKAPLPALVCTSVDCDSLTVALLDWHGDPAAAVFCQQHLLQIFHRRLQEGAGVEDCLRDALQEVDAAFLAAPDVPDKVKAIAGTACAIAHLDLRQQRLSFARLGGGTLALGQLLHGLAAQLTEGCLQFPPEQPANGLSAAQLEAREAGSVGIGDGRLKSQELAGALAGGGGAPAWGGPRALGPVHTASQQLTVVHEQIVLGSAGFWAALSANDAVLLSHFMTKAASVAVTPSAGGQPGAVAANIAAPLIQYARTRFGDARLLAGCGRRQTGADTTAIVVTLRWPATSFNQAFPARTGAFLDALREQRDAPDLDTSAGRARLRWRTVHVLLVEFGRARRRALRQRWLDAVSGALAAGKRRALAVEQLYWAKHQAVVRVTPSGVVTDAQGKALLPTAIPLAVAAL